jgi:hypothetical protein
VIGALVVATMVFDYQLYQERPEDHWHREINVWKKRYFHREEVNRLQHGTRGSNPSADIRDALGKNNEGRNNQPCDYENCALLCAWDGQLERHREQHARKNMSGCPRKCRQDIGGIKL